MGFDGAGVDYDRFMGRYSAGLSAPFADLAGVRSGQRVLDVGCGPGALTGELVARVGASSVTGVDPSASYAAAARERFPDVRIDVAPAGALPFEDAGFDAVLAQLVVHFLADPVHDLREMARVTRAGGVVAACVWDHAGGASPLSRFWDVLGTTDPEAPKEADLPGTRAGQLGEYLTSAGLHDITETVLTVRVMHPTFEDWWQPYLRGAGPIGAYIDSLDDAGRDRLERTLRSEMPDGPFEVSGSAWAARGVVPSPASNHWSGSTRLGSVHPMAIKLENVGIAVRDLDATIAFFTDLGLTVVGRDTVSGEWTDTAVGLDGNHARIAMLQTPDGHGQLELFEYIHPEAIETEPTLPNEI